MTNSERFCSLDASFMSANSPARRRGLGSISKFSLNSPRLVRICCDAYRDRRNVDCVGYLTGGVLQGHKQIIHGGDVDRLRQRTVTLEFSGQSIQVRAHTASYIGCGREEPKR